MSGTLSRFRIEALHNRHTIDVRIEDNKLSLVGENGTGKSTVANFIYFFLTRQWHRMLNYGFKAVVAVIDSVRIEVTQEDLVKSRDSDRLLRRLPPSLRSQFLDLMSTHSIEYFLQNREETYRYARQLELPLTIVSDYIEHFSESEEARLLSEKLEHAKQSLEALITDQVLYLPTYRRVEQDLGSIVPELASSSEFKASMERWKRRAQSSSYIELVQFGMQDVEETIKRKMKELGDSWRDDLSKLTGTYLRDVIQGAYQHAEPSEIIELDEATINAIFNRIDQTVLPEPEQKRLRAIVAKIKVDHHIQSDEKVIVHFLTRLIELHTTQQEKEKDVREFIEVCNEYLSGKGLIYDNMSFEISIKQRSVVGQDEKEGKSEAIKMSMLSSGEKQIVSLFSQIYLAAGSSYFVIIDEPELSLSVFWQKRFLPDILESGRCSGLIAVTHSPFIFENQLDSYAHSLEQFMEPADAFH
ncbi:MAG TPA: AAA family ATPase [Ktedonobacteraceae bacterium]